MDPASFRKSRKLSQAKFAAALGLGEGSKGYISRLEAGKQEWPLKLALKLEQISGGLVPARTTSPEAAKLLSAEARA